ncbi:MAG TPA: hypothetical protein VGH19_21140 [Verrucomicrobiae bacterium]
MQVENPVIAGRSYTLKEGSKDHPLRGGLTPGVMVKVLRSLGGNLFEAQITEGKTVTVYGDNLDRGTYHEVSVQFVTEAPKDRAYALVEVRPGEDAEADVRQLLSLQQDVQAECSNTMVQRLGALLQPYEVLAVAHPGGKAHYFFRYRRS